MEQATGKLSFMEKISRLSRTKKIVWGIVSVLLGAYIVLVIARIPHAIEQQKTAEAVAKIHAARLTLDDVMGKNLPPDPGANADKTIEGVDANHNGIRDDVELAIFKLHPDSARIRAAELQYAMELQFQFTQVFSAGTFIAAIQEDGRGYGCIFDTEPGNYPDFSKERANQNKKIDDRLKEVKALILNTEGRKSIYENNYGKYMTSYTLLSGQDCDVSLMSLLN